MDIFKVKNKKRDISFQKTHVCFDVLYKVSSNFIRRKCYEKKIVINVHAYKNYN